MLANLAIPHKTPEKGTKDQKALSSSTKKRRKKQKQKNKDKESGSKTPEGSDEKPTVNKDIQEVVSPEGK